MKLLNYACPKLIPCFISYHKRRFWSYQIQGPVSCCPIIIGVEAFYSNETRDHTGSDGAFYWTKFSSLKKLRAVRFRCPQLEITTKHPQRPHRQASQEPCRRTRSIRHFFRKHDQCLCKGQIFKERSFARSLAETAYPSLAAYLPHLALPTNPFLHKPDPPHPFFLNPASSFHFSSLFSGDLGKPGRRRKARTVFSDAQLAGLERRKVIFYWKEKF